MNRKSDPLRGAVRAGIRRMVAEERRISSQVSGGRGRRRGVSILLWLVVLGSVIAVYVAGAILLRG